MKKLILTLTTVCTLSFALPAYAADSSIGIYLNGEKQESVGYAMNGRTLLPLRDMCDLLQIPIDYDASTKKISVIVNGENYGFKVGDTGVYRNGALVGKLDTQPVIRNSKTYLPLRYVAELLDMGCEWKQGAVWLKQVDYIVMNNVFQKYTGSAKYVEIPQGIVEIAENAFWNSGLTTVKLPDGLQKIGFGAFYGNDMQNVVVPDSVTDIGAWAFNTCTKLDSVNLPQKLKSLSSGIFQQTSLKQLVIPQNVERIEDYIFNEHPQSTSPWYTPIKSVIVPANVTEINDNAFAFCNDLTLLGLQESYAEEWAKKHDVAFRVITEQELLAYYK